MTLAMSMSGLIHRVTCKRLRRTYRAFAVVGDDLEAGEFIRFHKLDPCGSCFPELKKTDDL